MMDLVIMIGNAGVGKSTQVKEVSKNYDEVILVSRDNIREELYKDEKSYMNESHTKEANKKIDGIVRERIKNSLENKENYVDKKVAVIYDGCNVGQRPRKYLYDTYGKNEKAKGNRFDNVIAVVVHKSIKTAVEQDSNRKGVEFVGENVITGQYINTVMPEVDVDCDKIVFVGDRMFKEGFDPLKVNKVEDILKYTTDSFKEEIEKLFVEHGCAPFHLESVDEHINMCIAESKKYSDIIQTVAVFHDMGKGVARQYVKDKDRYMYKGHEFVGAKYYMNFAYYNNNGVITDRDRDIINICRVHMNAHHSIGKKYQARYGITEFQKEQGYFFAEKVDDIARIRG